jgi:hypothetical protein
VGAEISDRRSGDLQSLGTKERTFQFEVTTITPEFARGGDDTMTRHIRPAAVAHDVAHRTRRARSSRRFSDVAVGGDAANGNSPDDGNNGFFERSHS